MRYRQLNAFLLGQAKENKDTLLLAESYRYLGRILKRHEVYDSAYYFYKKSIPYYQALDSALVVSKMYYSMALMKAYLYDYKDAEELLYKAIVIEKNRNDFKSLSSSYNLLGLVQKNGHDFENAKISFKNALKYLPKEEVERLIAINNNIGVMYQLYNKQDSAIHYFKKGLNLNNEINGGKDDSALFIDNRAYSYLLKEDTVGVFKDMLRAKQIRDSIGNKTTMLTSNLHLAEYELYAKRKTIALGYGQRALQLAKELKNGRDYLQSLQLLAKIDSQKSKKYLEEYIYYSDSLQKAILNHQNKFARIDYETEQYKVKNKDLEVKNRNTLLYSLLFISLLIAISSFLYNRNKKEKLQRIINQQQSDEKMYRLEMKQQLELEEQKVEERKRIAEELHDGILGKMFGVRLGLEVLAPKDEERKEVHKGYIKDLISLEEDIREVSHKLHNQTRDANKDFKALVEEVVYKACKSKNLDCEIHWDTSIPIDNLTKETKVHIVRLIQEAVTNALKHAQANKIRVDVRSDRNYIIIEIEDNGKGFQKEKKSKGIGLQNMKSRIEKMGGRLEVLSEKNKGTKVEIYLPKTEVYERS